MLELNDKEFHIFNLIKPKGFSNLASVLNGKHLSSFAFISSKVILSGLKDTQRSSSSSSYTPSLSSSFKIGQNGMIMFDLLG